MSKKIIVAVMFGVFLSFGVANAQIEGFPSAGVTPGNPLFFLDRFFENVGTFFTFGEANKARRYLALSEERLAEIQALAEEQDNENTAQAVEFYEEQLTEAKERAGRTGDIDLEAEVTDATTRHLSAFDQVIERVPEQARESVQGAKERTMTGQLEALQGIAQEDPERAAGIFATAAEGRLQAARARAERDGEDDEKTEEVGEALGEYEKYAQFGEEISQIAQGLGKGETEVRTIVERATEQHMQVLQDVKSKVPSQAQEGVNRAMQNAERVKQFLPADIPGGVGPGGNGGEEESNGTIPEQIPSDVEDQIPQSGDQGEEEGVAETPGGGFAPEGVGGEEDEGEGVEQQEGGPPAGTPGGRP